MHVSISTLYFIIKKTQLPPNWNCRKQLTTQVTCLRFCDLITKVWGWTLVLNGNIHLRLIAYNLRWEGSLKVIKANNSKLYALNQSLRQRAECGDKTFWEVVRNLSSGFLLLSKTLFRDPLFHLLSCENQITSVHFHFLIYKMRKWPRWPGKVLLVLISRVLWKYRNFRKNLKHELS